MKWIFFRPHCRLPAGNAAADNCWLSVYIGTGCVIVVLSVNGFLFPGHCIPMIIYKYGLYAQTAAIFFQGWIIQPDKRTAGIYHAGPTLHFCFLPEAYERSDPVLEHRGNQFHTIYKIQVIAHF